MEYYRNCTSRYEKTTEEYATHVMIPINEYHGYQKATRIVRNRSLQQIDRANTDEHGYMLLRADKREYKNIYGRGGMAWLVTRRSPYAARMDVKDAAAMIDRDMRDYYLLRDRPTGITIASIIECHNKCFETGCILTNETYEWMAETDGKVTLELARIYPNFAAGCYEVSFWATEPM